MTSPARAGGTPSARGRLLTGTLLLPAGFWYLALLVAPILIVVVYSFGERATDGGYSPALTLDNYATVLSRPQPFITSLGLAVAGTALCLLVAYPLAYYIASRGGKRKGLLIILLVIPFWTSFLVRTISWLVILGPKGLSGLIESITGNDTQLLGTPFAVLIGIVYNYLPLMVFPLYVTLERLDRTLLEASKDLYADRLRDVPPDHAADHLAGPDHRQHPRVHPADGRVRDPGDPGQRQGVPDRERPVARLPLVPQLAGGIRQGRGPDRDHAGLGDVLRVDHQPWPTRPGRERPVRPR